MKLYPGRRIRWAIAPWVALLAACAGAPSDSEIKEAITRQTQAEVAAMNGIAGSAGAELLRSIVPEIKGVKKIGCQDDGEKAYRCDVELEVALAGQTSKSPVNMRFVKGSEGWMVQN